MFESKKKGFRMEDAAKQYGVGLSTVYKIVQNGEKVLGSPLRDSAKSQAMKQASFSYFILYLRKTPNKRKLPIREKKGATNFSLIRSFDCTKTCSCIKTENLQSLVDIQPAESPPKGIVFPGIIL